jgi:SAM-dependent methyltransferase
MPDTELVACSLCGSNENTLWAEENNYFCVKCSNCGLLFVNPRPSKKYINEAASLGVHFFNNKKFLDGRAKFKLSKINNFRRVILKLNKNLNKSELKWLDVGAGHGEFLFALKNIIKNKSIIEGIDPMEHKVKLARKKGLIMHHGFVKDIKGQYDVISLLDVFSHVPDFKELLNTMKKHLYPDGEIIIKTGNNGDIVERENVTEPLNLPDHLVFAGHSHLSKFLSGSGFTIIKVYQERIDGIRYTLKNIIKKY